MRPKRSRAEVQHVVTALPPCMSRGMHDHEHQQSGFAQSMGHSISISLVAGSSWHARQTVAPCLQNHHAHLLLARDAVCSRLLCHVQRGRHCDVKSLQCSTHSRTKARITCLQVQLPCLACTRLAKPGFPGWISSTHKILGHRNGTCSRPRAVGRYVNVL